MSITTQPSRQSEFAESFSVQQLCYTRCPVPTAPGRTPEDSAIDR